MKRFRITWYLTILLIFNVGLAISAAGTPDQPSHAIPQDTALSRIHEVEILVIPEKRILHVEGDDEYAGSTPAENRTNNALEAKHVIILHPLLSNLTLTNTEAKLIQSVRRELHAIGIKVTRIRIEPYSGSVSARAALTDAASSAPRSSALLVISPTIVLSMDYRN